MLKFNFIVFFQLKKSVQGISTNTNPGIPPSTQRQSYRSSKRLRVKELIMKKIFKEDDSYATGEYSKEENGDNVDNVFYSEKGEKRETWSGKFDVIIHLKFRIFCLKKI
jgi:hypothetical protein